jgi:hypothetical protein
LHDGVAEGGSDIREPPREPQPLVAPEGAVEMTTLFQETGSLMYVGPRGTSVGHDDVFTRLEKAHAYGMAVGRGELWFATLESLLRPLLRS